MQFGASGFLRWFLNPFFLVCLAIGIPIFAAESRAGASAGWAEVEITPPLGIALGGRGGPDAQATKIIDPLYAQVLVLKDEKGTAFVLVSMDVVGIQHDTSDRIRMAIAGALGVQLNLVVINCSHTHSGPFMYRHLFAGIEPYPQIETDYLNSLVDKIIATARHAANELRPVRIEVFSGKSEVGVNRRGKNRQGQPGILPNAAGPFGTNVWVMKLSHPNGEPAAVLFSYACHPVLVYGFAYTAISADFPGAARKALREELGEQVHVQFVQALGGNVRPRINADLENNRWRPANLADVQRAGGDLARDVVAATKTRSKNLKLDLAGTMDRPFLPRGERPPASIYEKMAASTNQFQQTVARYWLQRYRANEGFARGDSWPVGLIRLAENQWIAYLAGEPVVEWGPKIASWLAPRDLVVWGYCQESISYLPTEELLPEGGYEVAPSNFNRATTPAPFAAGIHEAIRASLLRQAAFIAAPTK
jgi:neutral ceramidase